MSGANWLSSLGAWDVVYEITVRESVARYFYAYYEVKKKSANERSSMHCSAHD